MLWIGLLYSILSLSAFFQSNLTPPIAQYSIAPSQESQLTIMALEFRERTVQCLVTGRYLEASPYGLETLLHYFCYDYFKRKDADISSWMLMGIIVRLSMRMGYHRDPKHFSNISPAAGEMRRRAWYTILQLDLATSIQMGMPRMAMESHSDTEEPRNLLDTDFDENTTELPPSRPETDPTAMLYMRTRGRITSMLASISDMTMSTKSCSYEEIMAADKKLQEVHDSFPSSYKWRPMSQSITDSAEVIIRRLYLEIVWFTGRIILHRRYSTDTQTKEQFLHSRQVCVESAEKILEFQHLLEEEIQPTGQLYEVRWKIGSLLYNHFLFATSILCFHIRQGDTSVSSGSDSMSLQRMTQLLKKSYRIWVELSSSSREAQKTVKALEVVFQTMENGSELMDLSQSPSTGSEAGGFGDEYAMPPGKGTLPLQCTTLFQCRNMGSNAITDFFTNFNVQFPIFDPFLGAQQWDQPGFANPSVTPLSSDGLDAWIGGI